jgi:hypothetical protein
MAKLREIFCQNRFSSMGLPTFARNALRTRYRVAFSPTLTTEPPTVIVYELMQDMKWLPKTTEFLWQAIFFHLNKVRQLQKDYPSVNRIVITVDRAPPVVKRLVEHTKRYAAGKKHGSTILQSQGTAHLPADPSGKIPQPWISFAGNYQNLQREYYARLLNAFVEHLVPALGQTIYLHGFPGFREYVQLNSFHPDADREGRVLHLHQWDVSRELPITPEMEAKDPDLYNRVFTLFGEGPTQGWSNGRIVVGEREDMRNSLSEGDAALFFYDHFFPNERILLSCNDGDVLAYGLLYAKERLMNDNVFRNFMTVRMPDKRKKGKKGEDEEEEEEEEGKEEGVEKSRWEYVDFNVLYALVLSDADFVNAGVQNHPLTLAFMLIMCGSDFFQDYMKGIGIKTIWDTFLAGLEEFSHLVQMSEIDTPATRVPRQIVLDETAFSYFVRACYRAKVLPQAKKAKTIKRTIEASKDPSNPELTVEQIRDLWNQRAQPQKLQSFQFPMPNTVLLWSRQVLWNLLYFKNGPMGAEHCPDPFEKWNGLPYFPYDVADDGAPVLIPLVASSSKPVDEVYSQHFWDRRHADYEVPDDSKKRKRAIVAQFKKKW